MSDRTLHIAILGTRGIPARYGGFETFAEELSVRLVSRGHRLLVYRRRAPGETGKTFPSYRGVGLRTLPAVRHKYLETPLHTLLSFLDLFFRKADVVLLCNAANSPFAWLAKLKGAGLLINVDGIERRRGKWNLLGRLWYRLGERCSVWFADRVIADAQVISRYYEERYGCPSEVIAYGAEATRLPAGDTLKRFGLESGRYLLYVSRLEPENNALGVVEAYNRLSTEMPLVVVGDAPYGQEYILRVKEAAGSGVIFTGYQFGDSYRELCSHCYLYIQAGEVGGTHPALVENMAFGNCIVANSVPEHLEVLQDAGVYYRRNDFLHLSEALADLIANPDKARRYGQLAGKRAALEYSWERVCDAYERLALDVVRPDVVRAG